MAFSCYPSWNFESEKQITNFINQKAGSNVISISQVRADKLFLIQKINQLAGITVTLSPFDRHNIIKIIEALNSVP